MMSLAKKWSDGYFLKSQKQHIHEQSILVKSSMRYIYKHKVFILNLHIITKYFERNGKITNFL